MRAVYLLRHGQPELPGPGHWCYGRTDYPLSGEGWAQAQAAGAYFGASGWARGCTSPLLRCVRTAEALQGEFVPVPGLAELDMGDWDGLPFTEITSRWPEEFAARSGRFLSVPPPGGETPEAFRDRIMSTFRQLLDAYSEENLLLVAHNAVNAVLCAELFGGRAEERIYPYAAITQLLVTEDGPVEGPAGKLPGELPPLIPDEGDCLALLREFGTPQRAAEHCRAAADAAAEMALRLQQAGFDVDARAAFSGALLHDIAKAEPHHASAGARWLTQRGYARMAAIVGDHMHLPEVCEARWSEKTVVFLADKLVKHTRRVTLEERYFFDDDPRKAPYRAQHYAQAKRLLDRYNNL